jgi:hypothetical protein
VSGFDGIRTITYTGATPDEAQAAFEADRERARAVGYVSFRTRWDTTLPLPTLVAEYRFEAGEGRLPATPATSAGRQVPAAPRSGAFREAVLITGLVLAVIVVLAAIIPTAPQPPPAAPLPSAGPVVASPSAASPSPAA